MARTPKRPKAVETLTHDEASRKNIPTAEFRSVMERSEQSPIQIAYQRRNRDLDPQLVWAREGRAGLVRPWSCRPRRCSSRRRSHPKVLIDDLQRQDAGGAQGQGGR